MGIASTGISTLNSADTAFGKEIPDRSVCFGAVSGSRELATIINAGQRLSMRQQIHLIILFAATFFVALIIKMLFFPRLYGQNAYFFLSVFWICGVLMIVFLLNVIWHKFSATGPEDEKHQFNAWPNRRKTFRIIYPTFIRPTLVLDTSDHRPRRNLEFPVIDLSQEGSCFLDDGSLGPMELFAGRIRFNNGDQVKVSGQLVGKRENHISVRFNKSLEWSILLSEQRRVMTHMKPAR